MTTAKARKAFQERKRQVEAARILGMQSGENVAALTPELVRKHLFSLLDAPDIAERGLPGCVITEFKRCGRARCRCARGLLHGPYYYWYGRIFGTTWKHYLKREGAPRIIALCQLRRERRMTRQRLRASLRFLKAQWRYLDTLTGRDS